MTQHLLGTCHTCGAPFIARDCLPGYGIDAHGNRHCYACCGKRDEAEALATGRFTGYLVSVDSRDDQVTNWPGTLRFKVLRRSYGEHNLARTRTDVWFRDREGREWHGVQLGENSELVRCRRKNTK